MRIFPNMDILLQIVNATTTIPPSDPNTVNLVYATWAIAIATIIGIGVAAWLTRRSLKETKRSNELLEKELKARMIPLLQFDKTMSGLIRDDTIVRFTAVLKNTGQVPARKIIYRGYKSNNSSIYYIVKEWDSIKNISNEIGTIQQSGQVDFLNDIPWEKNEARTNWIIWFEYSYLDNQKEKAVVVFDMTGGLDYVPHRWYVHDDVIEAEKRRDDERAGKISAPT